MTSTPKTPPTDVRFDNHGSVVMCHPLTQAAKDWVEENVGLEGWQWLGGGFAVEPRCVDGLARGMDGDGLAVEGWEG